MYCTFCGKQIADDSRFCCFCGKTLISNSVSNSNTQTSAMPVKNISVSNNATKAEKYFGFASSNYDSAVKPAKNFVMHFIGPSEPRDCDFSIVKNPDKSEGWFADEDEIDEQETTASTVEKTFDYALEEGSYTIYVNSYSREVRIKKGIIVDFTFDCSGFVNHIYINERKEGTEYNIKNVIPSRNEKATPTPAKSNKPDTILFTLHMIGPSKPAKFNYQIVRLNFLKQIIDQGTTYALSNDNKLTYNLTPGKYEVKIDRYTRVVNVGSANNVDFIFDCSHHFNSIQIIGDIKG